MFRELTRKKQQLSTEECLDILKNEKRGVLSVNGDNGYPYGMPMNHFLGDDGCIYFHCGKGGHRTDALNRNDLVSFCVYDGGFCNEGEWALNFKSVIVFGRAQIVSDLETVKEISRLLSLKFTDDKEYIQKEIDTFAKNTVIIKLVPENICGKRVNES